MNRLIFVLITLALVSCDSESKFIDSPDLEWHKVSSLGGGFEVYLPNAEVIVDTTKHLLDGEATVYLIAYRNNFLLDQIRLNNVYQVAYSERPDLINTPQVMATFDAKKEQIKNELEAVIIADDIIAEPNYFGNRVVYNAQLGQFSTQIISYMIYKDFKFYSFEVFTRSLNKTKEKNNPAIDKFFNSIKFL